MQAVDFAERGWIPDWMIRRGIRRLLAGRIAQERRYDSQAKSERVSQLARELRQGPLAVHTDEANAQHYEVPAAFFEQVLGPRMKYSCCLYERDDDDLAAAEEQMLQLTCQRAELDDGMDILELGCGWGSLTLWMAGNYPSSRVTAVSNSHSQRFLIEARAREMGLKNVRVITADMRDFQVQQRFHRVVSVEMFEHMRNYQLLLRRVAQWLTPEGKLFVHIFCHRSLCYLFETHGSANWMGRHFFTGGIMPSEDLLSHFHEDLKIARQWRVSGMHYARTCEDWLRRLDQRRRPITSLFEPELGKRGARLAVQRWRMFFMACAELFKYGGGDEWHVAHYLLQHSHILDQDAGSQVNSSRLSV